MLPKDQTDEEGNKAHRTTRLQPNADPEHDSSRKILPRPFPLPIMLSPDFHGA